MAALEFFMARFDAMVASGAATPPPRQRTVEQDLIAGGWLK